MKTFCLIFLFWLLLAGNVYAANNPTTWPYGGHTHPSRGRSLEKGELFGKAWLTFPDSADFSTKLFNKNALFPQTIFSKDVTFSEAIFYGNADFSFTDFHKSVSFHKNQFRKKADFDYTQYNSNLKKVTDEQDDFFNKYYTDFSQAQFFDETRFSYTSFSQRTDFSNANFAKECNFIFSSFIGEADFSCVNFEKNVSFYHASFYKDATFSRINFKADSDFSGAKFQGNVDFTLSNFQGNVSFDNCYFNKNLVLIATKFQQGAELRTTKFNKNSKIVFDHNTYFPNGKLNINWEQLKKRLYLNEKSCNNHYSWQIAQNEYHELDSLYNRVAHKNISHKPDTLAIKRQNVKARLDSLTQAFNKVRYDLTEIFYLRLRDNYLAQNNKASADAVMYELAERKADILNEPLWILYGWIMGWGYKPFQFLLAAFLLVALPFALFWYRRYYHLVLPLVDHAIDEAFKEQLKAPENLNKKSHFNHAAIAGEIIFPARVWHVIFFSTSVLLGIRFKKEWIEKKDRAFLWWVTAEWLIGIGLYILFAVLVKSNEFSYVKGLLGLS